MSYVIEVRGLDRVEQRLGVPLEPVLRPAFLAIGQEIKARIGIYPGPVEYPIRWKSEKQRRWYFAHRRGNLPYVRQTDSESQRLGPSWAVSMLPFGAVVGTRVTYAPFVQDAERQQPFHRDTGWRTDREVVEEVVESGVVERACGMAIEAAYG